MPPFGFSRETKMLHAILQLTAKRGTVTFEEVARELSISAALAESLFVELERHGYLKSIAPACGVSCGGCGASKSCGFLKGLRLWAFTEKGAAAARRLADDPGRAHDPELGL